MLDENLPKESIKSTVKQIEKALRNDRLHVSKVSISKAKFIIFLKTRLLFHSFYCLFRL